MKSSRLLALLMAAAISIPAVASAESIAVVNGTAIDKKELDDAVATVVQANNGQVQDSPDLREKLKDSLVTREVILQEAKKRGLDKQPDFQKRLQAMQEDLLRNALFSDILKATPVTEAQIEQSYQTNVVDKFKGTKEVHARQITLSSQADAQKVIDSLKKGAKFDDLVKTKSIDPSAKTNGGDMGWGNLSQMQPDLSELLKTLHKGQYTTKPFQTQFGWHVFRIEDIRDAQVPPLDAVKTQLARQLQDEVVGKAVADLRAKAKIQ